MYEIIKHRLGGMTAIYTVIEGTMQFTLVPSSREKFVSEDKLILKNRKFNTPDGAVQVHVFGDRVNRQYSAGQTMRNSESAFALKFAGQEVKTERGITEIVSKCVRDDGQYAEHHLRHVRGLRVLECFTVYGNGSKREIELEMLSSFSVGSLTPFRTDNGAHTLDVYRMRSQWSAEARLEKLEAEDLIMEPSWMNYGVRGERFGSIGSMPSKKFMPFIALTDRKEKVTWAASLAYGGSWQMEFYLAQDSVNLSGGLADFEFGHWRKKLAAGETLETPHAFLTCVCGGVDKAAQLLTEVQLLNIKPESEKTLPVIYNEYCRNWGKCSRENLVALIDVAAELGAKYFVIDAGWFYGEIDLYGKHWIPKDEFYPYGIDEIVNRIKEKGMKAGLWFEPESHECENPSDHLPLLKRGGKVIRHLERVFVDMTDANVQKGLERGVIDFLKKHGFEYVKIDYNENIGVGCDGAESLGEGLRRQVNAAYGFYKKLKEKLPQTVLEMCSSGGMRCEPSFASLGDMMSFSDIHETPDEAPVACDMQRVLHPSKSQIWATLHEDYDDNKLIYTLLCGFYGRLCISGYIDRLSEAQRALVKHATKTYANAAEIISDGVSRFIGKRPPQRHLEGYRGAVRVTKNGRKALIVAHVFDDKTHELKISDARLKGMKISELFASEGIRAELADGKLTVSGLGAMTAFAVLANC